VVVPRVDFFGKRKSACFTVTQGFEALWLYLAQGAIFIPLLVAATMIDFLASDFKVRSCASRFSYSCLHQVRKRVFGGNCVRLRPSLTIVPDAPGEATVKALSLGDDEEALFRLLALNVQNAGATYGRSTAL